MNSVCIIILFERPTHTLSYIYFNRSRHGNLVSAGFGRFRYKVRPVTSHQKPLLSLHPRSAKALAGDGRDDVA